MRIKDKIRGEEGRGDRENEEKKVLDRREKGGISGMR